MFSFMPSFIPNLLQVAPFVLAFSILCAKPLRVHTGIFYAVCTIAVIAVSWHEPIIDVLQESAPVFITHYGSSLSSLKQTMPLFNDAIDLLTSSYTGVCIYLIVMFIGALPKTPLVKRLLSIRSELSVLGGIIIMGHVVRIVNFPFLFANPTWVGIWGEPASTFMFLAAVIIGPLLTICFVVPWITSFKAVRQKMSHTTWKKTQILAYPFMALMIGQGFFLAIGHCLYGYPFDGNSFFMSIMNNPGGWLASFAQQVATAWMYLVLGIAYLVLRLQKWANNKARKVVCNREVLCDLHSEPQKSYVG